MAEVRYYGLGILSQLNNTKKSRVDDHFDINSVLFLFREPDIFLLIRYSPIFLELGHELAPLFPSCFHVSVEIVFCREEGDQKGTNHQFYFSFHIS